MEHRFRPRVPKPAKLEASDTAGAPVMDPEELKKLGIDLPEPKPTSQPDTGEHGGEENNYGPNYEEERNKGPLPPGPEQQPLHAPSPVSPEDYPEPGIVEDTVINDGIVN